MLVKRATRVLLLASAAALFLATAASSSSNTEDGRERRRRRRPWEGEEVAGDRARMIAERIASDLGLEKMPNRHEAHVSVRSYRRAHHLYDLAREQTDLVRRIKMTEEEEEEQRREGSAKKSARSYVHRTYELKETTDLVAHGRRKREAGGGGSGVLSRQRTLLRVPPLKKDENEDGHHVLFVKNATVSVRLVRAEEGEATGGRRGSVTLALRQVLDEDEEGVIVNRRIVRLEEGEDDLELELLATPAAEAWLLLDGGEEELVLEAECDGCAEEGVRMELAGGGRMEVEAERRREEGEGDARRRRKRSHYRSSGSRRLLSKEDEEDARRSKGFYSKSRRNVFCPPEGKGVVVREHKRRRHRQRAARRDHRKGRHHGGRRRRPRCCLSSMEMDFPSLGPSYEFVLKPTSIDIGSCDGRCPAQFATAHTHAYLQSLLHVQWRKGKREDKVKAPCCVPGKVSDKPVMHLSADGTDAEVSIWQGVVAESCNCA